MAISTEISFREYLYKEFSSYNLSLSIRNYLIELLASYVSSEHFFEKKQGQSKYYEKSLVELYEKSQKSSNSQERIYFLKKMGDFSLCLTGFFRDSIKKKIISISYYEDLGQSAYHTISQTYEPQPTIFTELSKEFKFLSKVLFCIQKQAFSHNQSKYLLDLSSEESCFSIKPGRNKTIQ